MKFRPDVSKKGNFVAEGKGQKPNVPPKEWHGDRDMSTPFPVQNQGGPNKNRKEKQKQNKQTEKKTVLVSQKCN